MSYGLQIRDAGGAVTVSVEDRITRVHGVYAVTISSGFNVTGWHSVSGMVNDGTWLVLISDPTCFVKEIGNGGFTWFSAGAPTGGLYTFIATVLRY